MSRSQREAYLSIDSEEKLGALKTLEQQTTRVNLCIISKGTQGYEFNACFILFFGEALTQTGICTFDNMHFAAILGNFPCALAYLTSPCTVISYMPEVHAIDYKVLSLDIVWSNPKNIQYNFTIHNYPPCSLGIDKIDVDVGRYLVLSKKIKSGILEP